MVGELFFLICIMTYEMCYLVTMVDALSFPSQIPSPRLGLPQVAQQQFLKHAGTCLMVQNHGLETHMSRP